MGDGTARPSALFRALGAVGEIGRRCRKKNECGIQTWPGLGGQAPAWMGGQSDWAPEPQRKMLRKAGHRWVGRKSMPGRNSRAGAGRQKWLEGTRAP